MFDLQLSSHTQTLNNPFEPYKWNERQIFVKEVFLRRLLLRLINLLRQYVSCMNMYMCI